MLILFTAEHLHFGVGLVNQIIYERLNGFVRLVDGSSRGGRYVTSTTCPSTLVGYSERYGYNGRGVYLRVCTEESICLSIGTLYKKHISLKELPFVKLVVAFLVSQPTTGQENGDRDLPRKKYRVVAVWR